MATHTFDRGSADENGTLIVSLDTFYGENVVMTEVEPAGGFFGLTAAKARAYAADLNAHADALDERNTQPPVISYGLTAKQHAALEAAGRAALDNPRPLKPRVVLVAAFGWEFDRWCDQNQRSRRDPYITRIRDGLRDAHKLQGLTDFDLFVLSEIPHHNEAMQLLSHRLATRPHKDSSQ